MINTNFNSILDLLKAFPDEQSCIDHLEVLRWNGNVVSPFDETSVVYDCKGNRYKCKNSGKYFNVKTATLFDNTKIPLQKWFLAIYLATGHKKGISSIQLSKDLGITQKSAWFMLQRIRACFGEDDIQTPLSGEVQIDETYVGGKISNMHNDKRAHYKGCNNAINKQPVLGLLNNGKVIAQHIQKPDKETILPILDELILKSATVITDNYGVYKGLQRIYRRHIAVSHSTGRYANGKFSTNGIEGFWSLFKRSILGIYHSVSPKHLQKYVDENKFRYNTRLMTEAERMNVLFANLETRTTYKKLIYG